MVNYWEYTKISEYYLNLGMCETSLSDGSIQRISGGGFPWAEHVSMTPLELENSTQEGGS